MSKNIESDQFIIKLQNSGENIDLNAIRKNSLISKTVKNSKFIINQKITMK